MYISTPDGPGGGSSLGTEQKAASMQGSSAHNVAANGYALSPVWRNVQQRRIDRDGCGYDTRAKGANIEDARPVVNSSSICMTCY